MQGGSSSGCSADEVIDWSCQTANKQMNTYIRRPNIAQTKECFCHNKIRRLPKSTSSKDCTQLGNTPLCSRVTSVFPFQINYPPPNQRGTSGKIKKHFPDKQTQVCYKPLKWCLDPCLEHCTEGKMKTLLLSPLSLSVTDRCWRSFKSTPSDWLHSASGGKT